MDPALATGTSTMPVAFQDGLGERRRVTDSTGTETIERLCLRAELTSIPSFEFALRERASRLAGLRHTCYARVRSIDRLNDAASTLAVASEAVRGVRLAALLAKTDRPAIDINAAVHLIRQLVSAVAVLHESGRDIAHGAIGPERIIVTPNARVIVVEHVLGAALEQLHYSRDRYWTDLRVALPASPTGGLPRLDQRSDVTELGVVALSLVLGRLLKDEEYPTRIADVLSSAWANSSTGELEPMPPGLRAWIGRTLQLDPRGGFASAIEARDELERVLSGDGGEEIPDIDAADSELERSSIGTKVAPLGPSGVAAEAAPPARPEVVAPGFMAAPRQESSKVEPAPQVERASPHAEPVPLRAEPARPLRVEPRRAEEAEPEPASGAEGARRSLRVAAVAAAALVVLVLGGLAARRFLFAPASAASTGTFSVTTDPAGAQLFVDGQARGVTPLTITLNPGPHSVELRGDGAPRTLPITIVAGQQVAQYVELPKGAATLGQLQVRTEPAGAQVTIDGVMKGNTPLLVDALAPGEHAIVLQSDIATLKQTVTIEAGQTASLVVPLAPADGVPVSGWIAVQAPVELQLFENKKLLGTTLSDRIMVSAGRHEIEIVNDTLGYRVVRTVQVPAGRVAPIALNWPTGSVAVNALPWAEVWVEGQRMGETPMGNLALPIGPHEIVFRHPELGEQRQAVTVTLKAPSRVSVDLRKKP